MNKHRSKTCTHCGRETHAQPQDYNHDSGYGHCYQCLNKKSWYVSSCDQLADRIFLCFWESLDRVGGELTSDDSHGKVVEVTVNGKVDYHATIYATKEKIRESMKRKYLTFQEEEIRS